MPIQALTPAELKVTSPSTSVLEYEEFLRDCAPGHGGRIVVADEGAGRLTVKNRLNQAAALAGVVLRFPRAGKDLVVFEVLGKVGDVEVTPSRRGRPKKDA
jgi:hypothetical protein